MSELAPWSEAWSASLPTGAGSGEQDGVGVQHGGSGVGYLLDHARVPPRVIRRVGGAVTEQDWQPLEESPEVAAAVRDDTTVSELASDDAVDEGPLFLEPSDPEER